MILHRNESCLRLNFISASMFWSIVIGLTGQPLDSRLFAQEAAEQQSNRADDQSKTPPPTQAEVTKDKEELFGRPAVEIPTKIDQYMHSVKELLESGSARQLLRQFAFKEMLFSLQNRGLFSDLDETELESLSKLLRQHSIRRIQQFRSMAWDEAKWLEFETRDDGSVVLLARHFAEEDGTTSYVKWYLQSIDGQWRIVDYESLDVNLRFTTLLRLGLEGVSDGQEWPVIASQFFDLIWPVMLGIEVDEDFDFEFALDLGEKILRTKPPEDVVGLTAFLQATLLFTFGDEHDEKEALDYLSDLEKSHPEMPVLYYLRGTILEYRGEYSAAIESFLEYGRRLDFDANLHEQIADCYFYVGQRELSAKHAELGLKERPLSIGCLCSFAAALQSHQLDRLEPYLAKHEFDEGVLEAVIDWVLGQESMPAARFVFDLLQTHHPQSELIEYYEDLID